jgi:hypothetical protein
MKAGMRSYERFLPGEGPLRILGQLIGEPEQVLEHLPGAARPRLPVVGQSPRSGRVSPGRRLARRPQPHVEEGVEVLAGHLLVDGLEVLGGAGGVVIALQP